MFAYARTLRSGDTESYSHRLDVSACEFAVVDLETTGFAPDHGDRIVEVAVVRMRGDGTVTEEWSTLVDPRRPVGATAVHRIAPADVIGAPVFADIASELVRLFDGAVVVAHNASFEERFLTAEFAAAGVVLPPLPAVCTMTLARTLDVDLRNHKLATCCAYFGIDITGAHAALADARATARLLLRALDKADASALAFRTPVPVRLPPLLPYAGTLRARAV